MPEVHLARVFMRYNLKRQRSVFVRIMYHVCLRMDVPIKSIRQRIIKTNTLCHINA